jgi:glycosyltransferase involved in cell wall biosynthesis
MYARLEEKIRGSRHRDRYELMGWQPWSAIPSLYRSSHIGLSVDAMHYESLYGTRTRLVEMAGAGLPIIATTGPELSHQLEDWGAAMLFEPGDWQQLGAHILELSVNPERRGEMSRRALRVVQDRLSFAETTRSLRAWAARPTLSPDSPRARAGGIAVPHKLRTYARRLIWEVAGADR